MVLSIHLVFLVQSKISYITHIHTHIYIYNSIYVTILCIYIYVHNRFMFAISTIVQSLAFFSVAKICKTKAAKRTHYWHYTALHIIDSRAIVWGGYPGYPLIMWNTQWHKPTIRWCFQSHPFMLTVQMVHAWAYHIIAIPTKNWKVDKHWKSGVMRYK